MLYTCSLTGGRVVRSECGEANEGMTSPQTHANLLYIVSMGSKE